MQKSGVGTRLISDFWTIPAACGVFDNANVGTDQPGCAANRTVPPPEISSDDPAVLRAALIREHDERRRADCLATMQAEVVQLAVDLLVREPDIEGFFGGLTKTMVEETDSHVCAVWLIDDQGAHADLWMAYVRDRLYTRRRCELGALRFPHESLAHHLMAYGPGRTHTIEYQHDDVRLPGDVRDFHRVGGVKSMVVSPLVLGSSTLGWIKLSSRTRAASEGAQWWRVVLIEAIARQAALALHHNRLVDRSRLEERRKVTLEERNRLARDIHDNLAQGFGAILMQLQAAQREAARGRPDGAAPILPPSVADKIGTAVDLARQHLVEARRSVASLRPNVEQVEEISTALKRVAELAQMKTKVPIETTLEDLPRCGDIVEREIVGIAQEALTNAVRHARAHRITVRASTIRSIGLRLSIADDGRGIPRNAATSGFGMTSMQERAERIGASLTIVTAPRGGTEIVLAWEPSSLPTQVHLAS